MTRKEKKRIEKKNAAYAAMTQPERAVAVAKDVIEQVRLEKFLAATGAFIQVDVQYPKPWHEMTVDQKSAYYEREEVLLKLSADERIEAADVRCEVCGVGAACISAIRLFNDFESEHGLDVGFAEIRKYLVGKGIFEEATLEAIEVAFEGGYGFFDRIGSRPNQLDEDEFDTAVAFGERFDNPEDRLVEIMRNVVRNEGRFIP